MKKYIQIIEKPLLFAALIIMAMPLKSQNKGDLNYLKSFEVSTGFSYLIYQSGSGLNGFQGIEILVAKRLGDNFKTETGFRASFKPVLPEGFVRINVFQDFNKWQPVIGLETGITSRADLEGTSNLLKESREAMLKDIGYLYFSTHIEILSFNIYKKINISMLELDIGTHYKHFGRTLRAQTTLIRIRKSF